MSANTKSSESHLVLVAVWEEAEEMKVTADDLCFFCFFLNNCLSLFFFKDLLID